MRTRIVQKYGGTSVRDIECILRVAKRIKEQHDLGHEIVVVVSARAGVTDRLISDAKKLSKFPNLRELDALLCVGEQETVALLSIALNEIGVKATSRLAFQIGLQTCDSHGCARIRNVIGRDFEKLLADKYVIVVAGFQGLTDSGNLTTLGRGGSDLTALALAHRLNANRCEIFTDVNGVYTGDPKIIKNAKLIKSIDFESLLRLSFFDNKIMQDRSIAFAQKHNISFAIGNSLSGEIGTVVVPSSESYESSIIGITSRTNLCLLSYETNKDIVFEFMKFFKFHGIDICFIKHRKIKENVFFDELSVSNSDFEGIENKFFENFGTKELNIVVRKNLSRVDIIGTNVQNNERALRIFEIMDDCDVIRSEYGKHGLSFLITSGDYQGLLNKTHDLMFKNS